MKVYLASDGSILRTTPTVIGRGSTIVDFEVEAPFSAALIQVRFGLRAGTVGPLVLTRLINTSGNGYNVWYAKLPYAVTQFAGTVTYQIEITDADGLVIASSQGTLTISSGPTPTMPDKPPDDAWQQMRNSINQQFSFIEENALGIKELNEDLSQHKTDATNRMLEHEKAIADQLTYVRNAIGRLAAFGVDDQGHYVIETIEYDNLQKFDFSLDESGRLCVSYAT